MVADKRSYGVWRLGLCRLDGCQADWPALVAVSVLSQFLNPRGSFDIFGCKNLIFSGFESAKIHILPILKVPKTFLERYLFKNLVPLCQWVLVSK